MSTTMTLTLPGLSQPSLTTIPCCPKCGHDLSATVTLPRDPDETSAELQDAQKQIDDLQAQIRLLNAKATAAVDRWADYEDELAKLRKGLDVQKGSPQTPSINAPSSPTRFSIGSPGSGVSSFAAAATNRISALLTKKSTPNLKAQPNPGHQTSYSTSKLLPTPPSLGTPTLGHQTSYSTSKLLPTPSSLGTPTLGHQTSYSTSSLRTPRSPLSLSLSSGTVSYTPGSSPPPTTDDLLEALTREQELRLAAEGKLNDTSQEVEELSVTLFEQANEMVATERRMRARLEERVGELERREDEKKRRLERLEQAMGRIERVRSLLAESGSRVTKEEDEEHI